MKRISLIVCIVGLGLAGLVRPAFPQCLSQITPGRSFVSARSGNWNDCTTWTVNGSGDPCLLPAGQQLPGTAQYDTVTIQAGHCVLYNVVAVPRPSGAVRGRSSKY